MPYVGTTYVQDGAGIGTPQGFEESPVSQRSAAVVTSDTAANVFDALYIGVTGDVSIVDANSGATVLFKAVPVGVLPVSTSKVMATATTATNIVGLTL